MKTEKTLQSKELVFCSLFSSLIAAGAFIKIPVPVVPFTLQFLFTNLAGLLLGRRLGAISVGLYIAIGLVGLPVFVSGGGIWYVFHPTFGYLIGFLAGSFISGYIIEQTNSPSYKRLVLASFANLGIVYAFGMAYCYLISNYYLDSHIGVWSLILYCFILAVPGDIFLCFASATLAKQLFPAMKRG
ncbi:biotin biosynthesis protein BioY [Methanosarcina sp. 1.H.T.1A.1]|uniref:biotin transporter BioY n=1 Tax=Methanosarcina sp. 1.H.T.1A.1 TaxID=1483602 RepID=UPI00062262E4|nr:biotin transporter BioY [Methanosarcina sp. 1.H.T.1A.1]KKH92433.1 biotin biosynthesis protein BioY [Methanosarcina sp. 1.H.T.1A.1]